MMIILKFIKKITVLLCTLFVSCNLTKRPPNRRTIEKILPLNLNNNRSIHSNF
jgi:hypothetical protein